MKGKPTAVVFDLDSTLASTEHRQHLIPLIREGQATWEDYADMCDQDSPMLGPLTVMRLLWQHHEIHICSGRSGTALPKTMAWFIRHNHAEYYDYLRLRHANDPHSNSRLKVNYIRDLRETGVEVALFFEDYLPVAETIREETGVPVVVVNPGYDWIESQRKPAGDGQAK